MQILFCTIQITRWNFAAKQANLFQPPSTVLVFPGDSLLIVENNGALDSKIVLDFEFYIFEFSNALISSIQIASSSVQ